MSLNVTSHVSVTIFCDHNYSDADFRTGCARNVSFQIAGDNLLVTRIWDTIEKQGWAVQKKETGAKCYCPEHQREAFGSD